jgi:hypothetical protein
VPKNQAFLIDREIPVWPAAFSIGVQRSTSLLTRLARASGRRVERESSRRGGPVTIALAASVLAATTGTHGPLGGGTLHARHGNELGRIIRCGIVARQRRSHDQLVV